MRRISFLLVLIAGFAAHPAAAQRDTVASPSVTLQAGDAVPLTGLVVDARTGQPLRAAGVKLPAARVSVYTDEQGRFSTRVPPGTYGSVVGLLGYRSRAGIWSVAPGDTALLIRLEPDPIVLRGLVVQASRLERRARATGMAERHWNRDQLVNTSFPNVTQFVFIQAGLPGPRAEACRRRRPAARADGRCRGCAPPRRPSACACAAPPSSRA